MMKEELENGIYGLVISLCQEISRADSKPIETAQEEVSMWLIQVAASLHDLNKETTET